MQINGRLIHIAGSSDNMTSSELLEYAHSLVERLVSGLLSSGARFLVQIGREPLKSGTKLPLIFDWVIVSAVYDQLVIQRKSYPKENYMPLVVLLTQDYEGKIPEDRKEIWNILKNEGLLQLQFLRKGWSSGAIRRIKMSEMGDILVCISGGEGVEHLAKEYSQRSKPVIAFDLELGASSRDGTGGGVSLWGRMLEHPDLFFKVRDVKSASALTDSIATRNGKISAIDVAANTLVLIESISSPTAFYVRLINKESSDYEDVEWFFRNVVDKFLEEYGYSKVEVGISKTTSPWLNIDIIDGLAGSAIVFADLTGLRSNNLIEFGFALGLSKKTMLMARKSTQLPFDTSMYDCYFWNRAESVDTLLMGLKGYIKKNIDRPSLVSYQGVI